jgi:hypothetical protein
VYKGIFWKKNTGASERLRFDSHGFQQKITINFFSFFSQAFHELIYAKHKFVSTKEPYLPYCMVWDVCVCERERARALGYGVAARKCPLLSSFLPVGNLFFKMIRVS